MKRFSYVLYLLLSISLIQSCACPMKTKEKKGKESNTKPAMGMATPPLIIYKTKINYNDKVPVTLSADKSEIASYPGSKDVFYKGKLATPTELSNGFLLDNRGIDVNVAFLDISYDTFSKMMRPLSKEKMFEMILDNDPLTEMYKCKRGDFKDLIKDLNLMIEEGNFSKCERLK